MRREWKQIEKEINELGGDFSVFGKEFKTAFFPTFNSALTFQMICMKLGIECRKLILSPTPNAHSYKVRVHNA